MIDRHRSRRRLRIRNYYARIFEAVQQPKHSGLMSNCSPPQSQPDGTVQPGTGAAASNEATNAKQSQPLKNRSGLSRPIRSLRGAGQHMAGARRLEAGNPAVRARHQITVPVYPEGEWHKSPSRTAFAYLLGLALACANVGKFAQSAESAAYMLDLAPDEIAEHAERLTVRYSTAQQI